MPNRSNQGTKLRIILAGAAIAAATVSVVLLPDATATPDNIPLQAPTTRTPPSEPAFTTPQTTRTQPPEPAFTTPQTTRTAPPEDVVPGTVPDTGAGAPGAAGSPATR
jgi:hypothetical protein